MLCERISMADQGSRCPSGRVWLDRLVKPMAQRLYGLPYNFIERTNFQKHAIIVLMDVPGLCTNIPLEEGVSTRVFRKLRPQTQKLNLQSQGNAPWGRGCQKLRHPPPLNLENLDRPYPHSPKKLNENCKTQTLKPPLLH